jgi:hypothetical protein
MIGLSIYDKDKNTAQPWLPMDTHNRWLENCKDPLKRKQLKDLGWSTDSIEYTLNSHGFRADEFTNERGIMFLGCSFTVGIGMDIERLWTDIVAKNFGMKHWNLGQGAGSPDTCFRLAYHWIPKLQPKYVCVLMPSALRKEVLTDNADEPIEAHYPQMAKRCSFYEKWISTDANPILSQIKNTLAIQKICNDANIPVIWADWHSVRTTDTDFARDLAHPGVEWNSNMAEYFIQNIKELK